MTDRSFECKKVLINIDKCSYNVLPFLFTRLIGFMMHAGPSSLLCSTLVMKGCAL